MPNPPLAPLAVVVAGYLLMMLCSYFIFIRDVLSADFVIDRDAVIRSTLAQELSDTALVAMMLLLIPRPPKWPAPRAWVAWVVAPPLLCVMLAFNFGYHAAARALFEWAGVPVPDVDDISLDRGFWAILLVCVQPAVVEELLFRHLFLGHLRPQVGLHGAVWVAAAAFAMAHVGRGAGWPMLAVLGAFLGYARVASGSMLLPIGLHFAHNLAALAIDEWPAQ